MQVGGAALLLLTTAVTGSMALLAATALTVAFSAAVARPHEEHDLARRHGDAWRDWRRAVRDWCPRWRPYASGTPAVLRLDTGCGFCVAIWRFLARRDPVNLTIAPAKEGQLRAGYTGGDGHAERGVAAVARALEHLNLGWAWVGWTLRLPGMTWLAQLMTDAMIAPPHPAGGERCPTPSDACSTAPSPRSVSMASPASRPAPSPPPPE
uniref:DUF393 domain-containing protein n=2 Tax=Salinispora arenicola TaxID=168697 RepID=A8M353_SALAI